MARTMAVLALDAADYALLQQWGCDNILLHNNKEMSTFSATYDRPYTPEVWATVATGKDPTEIGVTGKQADWDNPVLQVASTGFSVLPDGYRSKAGSILQRIGFESGSEKRDMETVFDEGQLSQWPGVTEAPNFSEAQSWLSEVNHGNLSDTGLFNQLVGNTGSEFGWLAAMSETDLPIVGIHSHILDVAGHVYSSRSDELKRYYTSVDGMVETLTHCCDELVIISDHGMEVSLLDDPDPGKHSWRAMMSTTFEDDLPDDVRDINPWLEKKVKIQNRERAAEELDAPVEHLKDLGYFS